MSIKSKIQALIAAANAKTGESDATLTDAVQTLVDGYGQGGVTVYAAPYSGYLYTPDYTQTVTLNSWETNDTVPKKYAFSGAKELVNYRLIVPSGQAVSFDNNRSGFFNSCSKLETVWLDAKMSYLTGGWMFSGCSSLKSVTIGNIDKPFAANDILANRFEGNSSIETVTFYVNAETMEDVPANLINRQPFGAPNATIIYRNSTTGEVITA
jgi:hypothetical protein